MYSRPQRLQLVCAMIECAQYQTPYLPTRADSCQTTTNIAHEFFFIAAN